MFEIFYPDETAESAYTIDYEKLWKEGYRGIIYDIDNTLVLPDAPADERSDELLNRLGRMGFLICLTSNNDEKRVEDFNRHGNRCPSAGEAGNGCGKTQVGEGQQAAPQRRRQRQTHQGADGIQKESL